MASLLGVLLMCCLQVRFGPWAMADGETPNLSSAECEFFKEQGYDWIFEQVSQHGWVGGWEGGCVRVSAWVPLVATIVSCCQLCLSCSQDCTRRGEHVKVTHRCGPGAPML